MQESRLTNTQRHYAAKWKETSEQIVCESAFCHMCARFAFAIFNQNELIRRNDMQNRIYLLCWICFAILSPSLCPLSLASKFRSKLIVLICFEISNTIYLYAGVYAFLIKFQDHLFPFLSAQVRHSLFLYRNQKRNKIQKEWIDRPIVSAWVCKCVRLNVLSLFRFLFWIRIYKNGFDPLQNFINFQRERHSLDDVAFFTFCV